MASVSYLASTRMGEKGQLTVPKEYRDELGLKPGAPIAVLRLGAGLILIPENKRFEQLCDSIASTLAKTGVSPEQILAGLPAARLRFFRKTYPGIARKSRNRK